MSRKTGSSLVAIFVLAGITFATATPKQKDANRNTPWPQYRILTSHSVNESVQELNSAGREGYRLERYALTAVGQNSQRTALNRCDVKALLRYDGRPDESTKYEYALVTESRNQFLNEALNQLGRDGWRLHSAYSVTTADGVLLGNVSFGVINAIIMERQVDTPPHIWSYDVQPNKPELLQQSETAGFRPVEVTLSGDVSQFSISVSKRAVILERSGEMAVTVVKANQIQVITAVRLSSLEKEIGKAAEKGLKIERISQNDPAVIMIGNPEPKRYSPVHYRISEIKGKDYDQALTDELATQRATGFHYCGIIYGGQYVVFSDEKQSDSQSQSREVFVQADVAKTNDPRVVSQRSGLETSLNEKASTGIEIVDLIFNHSQTAVLLRKKSVF